MLLFPKYLFGLDLPLALVGALEFSLVVKHSLLGTLISLKQDPLHYP